MECCRRLTTVLTMEGLGKIVLVMVEEVQEEGYVVVERGFWK